MARRATSSTKRQPRKSEAPEQGTPKAPRRGSRANRDDVVEAEQPVEDAVFANPDELPDVTVPQADEAPKARRGRKPKPQPTPPPTPEASAPEPEAQPAPQPEPQLPSPTTTAEQPPAARWDAASGAATFDWPSIERVAAAEGPNQAMAKLLLAARAEGANSRWPF